jgi:hypothetical protein
MTLSVKSTRWIIAGTLPLLLGAEPARRPTIDVTADSRIWVSGTSSVRAWECRATTWTFAIDGTEDAAAGALAGEKAVTTAELAIPTEKMECGNGTMNGHMKKALKAPEQTDIRFRMERYELGKAGDSLAVTIFGTLNLGGTEKAIEMAALGMPAADGALRVVGTYAFKMTEFDIKPPTMMFGRMKVHDQVKVGFDLLLTDGAR